MSLTIRSQNLPNCPNTVAYEITGDTPAQVQKEIDRVFRHIETVNGYAEFSNPKKLATGQYATHGYMITEQTPKGEIPDGEV